MAAGVLLCAGLASCSQDELPGLGNTLPDGEYPLILTASVDGMQTRSAGKEMWTGGEEIGVRIGTDGATGCYALNADGTVKETVTPAYWQNTDPATVTAWYPYAAQTDVNISDQQDGFSDFDFLTATAENQTFQSTVTLQFKHQMAKVSYTLQGEGVTNEELRTAVVTLLGDATATFENGVLAQADQTDGEITSCYDGETRTGAALLVPQDMTDKPLIKVSVGGSTFTYTPNAADAGNLQAGHHNTYTITVKADGIEVTTATGGEWTSGGSENVAVFTYKTDLNTAKVGDLITASGKLIDKNDLGKLTDAAKKQVVGVVFWTPSETDPTGRKTPASLKDDKIMSAIYPGCTHGLAVAVKKVTGEYDKWVWQDPYEHVIDWQKKTFTHDMKKDFASIASNLDDDGDNINHIYGYQNTVVLRAYNVYCADNGRSNYIINPVAVLDEFVNSGACPAPSNSTGWFLPSAKELHMLCYMDVDNIGSQSGTEKTTTRDIVNTSLAAVSGDALVDEDNASYWSSSERASDHTHAINVSFSDAKVGTWTKNFAFKVRAVCAF